MSIKRIKGQWYRKVPGSWIPALSFFAAIYGKDDTCTWTEDDPFLGDPRHFESDCGHSYSHDDDDTLASCGIIFCPYCGKKIIEVAV